ncbi:glycosyltransferase family protein [Methylobacterium radiotolerans]|uniref:glycosyltransferase family protein n=1 Tax=Methylobacterium TaxID=407 RepID=UPI000B047DFC|nr:MULTISPECIES: glycosyltransferase [Methylobacterium]MBN6819978.1 glycosyltransferase family 1 protein [Methylobacterium organophilum]
MSKPTLLLMDVFGILDASRSGLIDAFAAAGCDVVVANFAYTHLSQSEELSETLLAFLEADGVAIDGALSINAVGLSAPIYEGLARRGAAHAAWFVDSPFYFSGLEIPESVLLSVACSNFAEHPQATRADWLPFAGFEPRPSQNRAATSVGFLGSLHHIALYAARSQDGLVGSRTGPLPVGVELRDRMRSPFFMIDETWSLPDGTPVNAMEYFNFQSSMHRLELLSYFSATDLEIQGPPSWYKELWTAAPHLLHKFSVNSVAGEREMRAYMARYRICLNIFHIQNMNGGPNFRSFDAASHGVPCLSQYNRDCTALFPHGEAALYFNNPAEALHLHRELDGSSRLRQKLAAAAARVVRDGNTFSHRASRFLNTLALRQRAGTARGTIRHLRWQDGWTAEPEDAALAAAASQEPSQAGREFLARNPIRRFFERARR